MDNNNNNNNSNYLYDEVQMAMQQKKDQFRVEIRKKKIDDLFQMKRIQIYNRSQPTQIMNGQNKVQFENQEVSALIEPGASKSLVSVDVFRELEVTLRQALSQQKQQQQMQNMNGEQLFLSEGTAQARSPDATVQALNRITELVATKPCPIDQVFATGLPGLVLEILSTGSKEEKMLGGHIIMNLTAGSKEQVNRLIELDLFSILLNNIALHDVELGDAMLWALNNSLITNLNQENLLKIYELRPHIVEDLCKYFKADTCTQQVISSVILCLFYMTKICQINRQYYGYVRICLPYLSHLIDHNHPRGPAGFSSQRDKFGDLYSTKQKEPLKQQIQQRDLVLCFFIVSELSQGDSRVISDFIKTQIEAAMIRYLDADLQLSDQILLCAMRTLANISSGNEYQCNSLFSKNICTHLKPLMNHGCVELRREIGWLIGNLAAGNPQQIDIFLSSKGLFHALIAQLRIEIDLQARQELLIALSNPAEQGTTQQITLMVHEGILPIFADHLSIDLPPHMVIQLLEAIELILRKGICEDHNSVSNLFGKQYEHSGCHQKVSSIYFDHNNPEITGLADRILKIYQYSVACNL